MAVVFANLLSALPVGLRTELFDAFRSIEKNYREGRWEPSELNGGKLCEIVYSILKGHTAGSYPARAAKPANMVDACRALEGAGARFPRSIRIQIPRMLLSLYEVRNNRNVGHVGGDVDPNHMDAICVMQMSKWIVAELIRVFHGVSVDEAASAVDALSDRELTAIWTINGVTRVLDTSGTLLEKTLILLYGSTAGMSESSLVTSVEPSNPSVYRRDVLRKAHKKRLIEYDEKNRHVTISPKGSKYVEDNGLL